ncbi:nitroreductase family protein [Balneicella halophila]|nr:nitroreductase family protein [Balneicella halophila]
MSRNLEEALKNRRSYYQLSAKSPISDEQIEGILKTALTHVPSAFNSQSTRLVLLLGENHKKLWDITKGILKEMVPAEAFSKTEEKIDGSFASGYGTVLFYEDNEVVNGLQESFPTYKDRFPVWSQHTSAMHQLTIWTMLEDEGFGASLQHYNPIIDEAVRNEWDLNPNWELVAQMPFGVPTGEPGDKDMKPIDERLFVHK